MAATQACPTCQGSCDVEGHQFTPAEYGDVEEEVPKEPSAESIDASRKLLMSVKNFDVSSFENPYDFVGASEQKDVASNLLSAVNDQLSAGSGKVKADNLSKQSFEELSLHNRQFGQQQQQGPFQHQQQQQGTFHQQQGSFQQRQQQASSKQQQQQQRLYQQLPFSQVQ